MNFVSFAFLLLLSVVMLSRFAIGRDKTETAYLGVLLVASSVFYMWHVPAYWLALIGSAGVDFLAGRALGRRPIGTAGRKTLLVVSLVANLGTLAIFKYTDFAIGEFNQLSSALGFQWRAPMLELILPIGISFYTFQSMSYTLDIYRGIQAPIHSFSKFLLYVSFFPQLVAGPIVRAHDFLYQIDRRRRPSLRVFGEGGYLIVRGYFLKMVCADNLAPFVDATYARDPAGVDSTQLLVAAFLFGIQIFCDFAGYSSIARGVAYWLGFRLPVNFANPYLAGSFSNFWERWHITLSQWLRLYLYFPLGGNRVSAGRTRLNLMVVMLLGGLWHGAALNYVAWGGLHGAALVVERILGLQRVEARGGARLVRVLWYGVVQVAVFVAWIFFRSESVSHAWSYLGGIGAGRFEPIAGEAWAALAFALPVAAMHLRGHATERGMLSAAGPREKAVVAGLMLTAIFTLYGQSNAFIYFQF